MVAGPKLRCSGECGNCRDGALGYCDHFRAINLFGDKAGGSALARNGRQLSGLARELGATHVVSGRGEDPVGEIVDLTGGGANFSLDTTGAPAAVANSINCLRARGVSAQVAAPPRGTLYAAEASVVVGRGITVRGIVEGDANPQLFIPRMVEFFRQGRLPLDKFVKTYPLEKFNEAVDDLEHGRVVKPVLTMREIGSVA